MVRSATHAPEESEDSPRVTRDIIKPPNPRGPAFLRSSRFAIDSSLGSQIHAADATAAAVRKQ